jgi:hypothetical protein
MVGNIFYRKEINPDKVIQGVNEKISVPEQIPDE